MKYKIVLIFLMLASLLTACYEPMISSSHTNSLPLPASCQSISPSCRHEIPPVAPSFCPDGEIISKMDACGCFQELVCNKPTDPLKK
jgi:hypothetical protein